MLPVCEVCAGFKPQVGVRRVAALLPEVPVGPDAGVRPLDDLPVPPGVRRAAADATVALLSAEVAVLHARLDALQSRLASLETPEPPRNPAPD